jgi:hypothetical protein
MACTVKPQLAPGTLRLLRKMERSGAIEDRLMGQRLLAEARLSQLKLQTEAEEMQELKFTPETGRGKDGEKRVDVREVSQRLHQGAGRRDERQRQLQVGPPG